MLEITAQVIGVIAMLFNIFSYQGKSKNTVIILQLCGGVLFAVNFLMLSAVVGGLLNIIAAIRAVVFYYGDKLKADRPVWFVLFILSYITVYVLNFTLFGKEVTAVNLLIEMLPVIGMIALNVGYRLKSAAAIRKCAFVSSPAWLVYNIIAGSWGAVICEVFTLVSVITGVLRHDKNKSGKFTTM